jgi:hypothetical protein
MLTPAMCHQLLPKHSPLYCGLWAMALLLAGLPVQATEPDTPAVSPRLHIQARQVALPQVLDKLAGTTAINLHYAPITDDLRVSGDCRTAQLAEMLECLLGSPQNLVMRFSAQGKAEEAWLLSGNFNHSKPLSGLAEELKIEEENPDPLQLLAEAHTAQERIEAMRSLKSTEQFKDPALAQKLLTEAISDETPLVRASAISILVKLSGDNATPQLLQLLDDQDVTVRMAALSAGVNNLDFLTQAQHHADEHVRRYVAAMLSKLLASRTATE